MSTLIWQHSPKTACPCSYVLNQILSGDEVDTVVSKVQHYLEEGGRGTLAWCGVGGAHWPDVGWEGHIGLMWGLMDHCCVQCYLSATSFQSRTALILI